MRTSSLNEVGIGGYMCDKLGWILIEDFLAKTKGRVIGQVRSDARIRTYSANYKFEEVADNRIAIQRIDGSGDRIEIKSRIPIDRELVAFFGLYDGDGAKGAEKPTSPGFIHVNVSFSQREPNLVRFAVDQFRRLFSHQISFTFSLGEDSAYFMAGSGLRQLENHYGGQLPDPIPLQDLRPILTPADKRYLEEPRRVHGTNEEHLAFYYQHKEIMQRILTEQKMKELRSTGIILEKFDRVTASLRRPFKKGAREPGGSSRSDELHLGGLNGLGELFLKIMYELGESILTNTQQSPQGLVRWNDCPSNLGEKIDIQDFFANNPYGSIDNERPVLKICGTELRGQWPRSIERVLKPNFRVDPLFAYASGLYLAEGATPKNELFAMYSRRPKGLSVEFTCSEDEGISIMLKALSHIFPQKDVMKAWKIKVGSQYFPELVTIGLKHGVPMLRGGNSGDGKLRTMEISLALKSWALESFPSIQPFADRYSHVEPTGAGVARVHFWASSSLGKWLFPLMMYTVFHGTVTNPKEGFIID